MTWYAKKQGNWEHVQLFTYVNYHENRKIVFQVVAKNILEADEKCKKAGIDPTKGFIGCSFVPVVETTQGE